MNIIARAAIAIYDGGPMSPVFPQKPGKPDDAAGEYLSTIAEKLMNSDTSRTTCVEPGSAQEELLRRFGHIPFAEASSALLACMDDALQALEIPREGFDMAVFTFEQNGDPHLCVAQLPYRNAVVHQIETTDDGVHTMLLPHGTVLPPPGGKGYAGFVVNLSTGDIRLRDTGVLTNAGNRQLFAEALFSMAATRSTKEAVAAVTEMIEQAAPDVPPQELRPAIKRAMSKSIEEKGVIDVQEVAQEIFRSDEEREAIIAQMSQQMQEAELEPVIPVENKRVVAQLQKVKIRTDNGISITLPRTLADDENSFAVVANDDGTVSIIISRVQELRTE
ncbi:MAG: nucleoid-associated protein [Clostridia bacterium]|nr:nucleoid-associated protein [Clostridia bacterium]